VAERAAAGNGSLLAAFKGLDAPMHCRWESCGGADAGLHPGQMDRIWWHKSGTPNLCSGSELRIP
jgi:hypothetical protein